MSKTMKTRKSEGARFERHQADYWKAVLQDDRIDRRVTRGAKDRGDIGGVIIHGQPLVIECKDSPSPKLPEWARQAETERGNDDALAGVIIHKRRGTTAPGEQWVTMTVDELLAILTGSRSHIDGV